MRGLKAIQLQSLIIHVLDSKSSVGLVKSWREMPIDPNDRVAQYFVEHIRSSLADGRSVAATFQSFEDGDISRTCTALLDGAADLVSASHQLADRLYGIMQRDKRIDVGDLAVCTFTSAATPEVPRYVGILKLDPSLALVHRTEYENGLPFNTCDVADGVLPTVNEKLQKCAFVQRPRGASPYEMLVLDDQHGRRPGESVAQFFMEKYLHARPFMDSETCTAALIRAIRVGQHQVRKELTPEQRVDLETITRASLRNQRIDLDHWVGNLPIPEEAKSKLDEILRRDVPDRVITLDAKVVNAQVRKRKFRGMGGLRVDIPEDLYGAILRSAASKTDENGRSFFEVVLHTDIWEEVPTA